MSLSRSFRNVKVVLGAGKGTSYSMSIFKLCLLAKLNLRLKIIIRSYSPHIWCLKMLKDKVIPGVGKLPNIQGKGAPYLGSIFKLRSLAKIIL